MSYVCRLIRRSNCFNLLFIKIFAAIFCFFTLLSNPLNAQNDSVYVKYTRDFKLKDGIYQTFNEFKNNKPSLPEFEVVKDRIYGEEGSIILKYPCPDSIGSKRTCLIDECFAFCKNGVLYLSQGFSGYYYRMFIVGALSHYIAFNRSSMHDMYFATEPMAYMGSTGDYTEYLLDFETGNSIHFNFRDFSDFLKTHDEELYAELQKTKQKRKMIHHFLLKYNEKHPIYFPAP